MISQWFALGIFRVLRRKQCNSILALLAIPLLAEVDWDATYVEWFPIELKRTKFIFVPSAAEATRRRADETIVTDCGHDEIRPVTREEFADRGMSRDFADRAWNEFLEKSDIYTEYPMLKEQDRVKGYRNIRMASE